MTFEQQWIEYDYNPFVLFNINGKIVSLNSEAQFLLGSTTANELFDLAKAYANITFGFKTTFVDLEFGRYKFFGITVGYENEDQIGIKLYQAPSFKLKTPKLDGQLTNIFTLIDLCISTNSINSDIKYVKDYDPTIPNIIITFGQIPAAFQDTPMSIHPSIKAIPRKYFRIFLKLFFSSLFLNICGFKKNKNPINIQKKPIICATTISSL